MNKVKSELRDGFGSRHQDRFMGSGLGLGGVAIGLAPPLEPTANGFGSKYPFQKDRKYL